MYIQINGGSYGYTENAVYDHDRPTTAMMILIPIIMPLNRYPTGLHLGKSSYPHLYRAMFLRAFDGCFLVIIASSLGFLMAGYPPVIVLRALSHIVW